ncbi:MAG: hypothetical protein WC558_05510 [Patulibacter sp.]
MFELRSALTASAVSVALGLSLVAAAPATAQAPTAKAPAGQQQAAKKKTKKKSTRKNSSTTAKTVTACVDNRTGATKVLLGKKAKRKCPKGSTRMTWNVAGRDGKNGTGTNGANGANGLPGLPGAPGANGEGVLVRDAAGNRLGRYVGGIDLSIGSPPYPLVQVLAADGGIYSYLESGHLFGGSFGSVGVPFSPFFYDAACAGPAYMSSDASNASFMALFAGGAARIVHRYATGPSLDSLAPARVWKLTTTTSVVSAGFPPVYALDGFGVCAAASSPAVGSVMFALESVPAPPDGVGRLVIG